MTRRLACVLAVALYLTASGAGAVTVCLDPGHGGSDAGAVGIFYTEKAANLDVGVWTQTYLGRVPGVTSIGMTRTTDVYVSLADRCAYANNAGFDRFLSHHHNAATTTAQGTETYCYPTGSASSFDLRDKVHARLLWAFAYNDRGTKTADFYVLRNTVMPAVLGEAAFIDYAGSYNESQRFSTHENDHDGRDGYAYGAGLCDHAGLTPPGYGLTGVSGRGAARHGGVVLHVHPRAGRTVRVDVETPPGARDARVELTIRDVHGREVRAWRQLARTDTPLVWDGHGADGRVAAAGLYWVTAMQGANRSSRGVVLLP